jgi:hypothetical protein
MLLYLIRSSKILLILVNVYLLEEDILLKWTKQFSSLSLIIFDKFSIELRGVNISCETVAVRTSKYLF